jgi:hypothetical protein
VRTSEIIAGLEASGWRGRVGQLEPIVLEEFWKEAVRYARWEIKQYRCWRQQEEPVLADGYDAEGLVQTAFWRLISREDESVPVFYTVEGLRSELRRLVKHRVRWLHERRETSVVVSEWDVLARTPNGERVSVFDYLEARERRPDEEASEKEQEKLLKEFKEDFEKTLAKSKQLGVVFRRVWAGEKRREMAQRLGIGVARTKASRRQVSQRLARFAARAQGGVAEMLGAIK